MPRARNIKPGFFVNEALVGLPFSTRLLFIGLWTVVDREGRVEDRPLKIKMSVFPADDVDVEQGLQELHRSGLILRYQVANRRFIEVLNFTKHQNPHVNEKASVIPAPEQYDANTRAIGLNPDSLNPDSLNPESGKTRPSDDGEDAGKAAPKLSASRLIWEVGVSMLVDGGMKEANARSVLGKWAKEYGNEVLSEAIAVTSGKNPVNPVEFLKGVLKRRHDDLYSKKGKRSDVDVIAENAEYYRNYSG